MEKKIGEAGKLKASLKNLLIDGLIDFTNLDSSLYTAQSKGSFKKTKKKKKKLLQGIKWEENKKKCKQDTTSKSRNGQHDEQCA